MDDIYLETETDDLLRTLADYDSDEQSLTAHSREEIEVQAEIHGEKIAEDNDNEELTKSKK